MSKQLHIQYCSSYIYFSASHPSFQCYYWNITIIVNNVDTEGRGAYREFIKLIVENQMYLTQHDIQITILIAKYARQKKKREKKEERLEKKEPVRL